MSEHLTTAAFYDSHCHLDFRAFDTDRDDVLRVCQDANIQSILIPGVQASLWPKLISLCRQQPMLEFALGLHPYFLQQFNQEHLERLALLVAEHRGAVRAIGEIGLDRGIEVDFELQQQVFIEQLSLANQFDLPVIVHHRRSHNDLIRLLKQYHVTMGGVIHAFSGSEYEARSYIDMGFKLGVGGTITYERAQKTRHTLSKVPLSSLLLETDAPDMPLSGQQGQRNSPVNIPEIARSLAALRGISAQEVKQQCWLNYRTLFNC